MDFSPSPRAADLTDRVRTFIAEEVEPVEPQYHRDLAAASEQRWSGTHAFDVLSMGTSQDYAVAAAEGATIVRLGSVLYGGRPTQ